MAIDNGRSTGSYGDESPTDARAQLGVPCGADGDFDEPERTGGTELIAAPVNQPISKPCQTGPCRLHGARQPERLQPPRMANPCE